ncbi:MAG: alpha/beta fold hydrolase, partial [Candidatus Limnocylindrus sp.]
MKRRLTRSVKFLLVVALLPFLIDVPPGENAIANDLLATGAAPNARVIAVNGRSTVIAEAGSAADPELVLVHGFGGSTFGWRAVMAPIAARGWHVVALDLPGFGLSAKSWSADYGHEAQARFVLAAMDELGVERAVIVGHSMGGNVAAWIAALAPARVAGLALIDAAVVKPAAARQASGTSPAAALLSLPPLRRLGRIAVRGAFNEATFGTLLRSAFAVQSAASSSTIAGYAASARLPDWDLALLGIIR